MMHQKMDKLIMSTSYCLIREENKLFQKKKDHNKENRKKEQKINLLLQHKVTGHLEIQVLKEIEIRYYTRCLKILTI